MVRRCGASSEKSCGGKIARKRLKRPCSSCRARGGVPYGIDVAPASGRRRARQSSHTNSLLMGARVQPYQVKQAVHRKVPVGAVGVSTDAARRGASVTLRASNNRRLVRTPMRSLARHTDRGRRGNEGATAGDDRKMNNEPLEREPMNNEPLEREPIDRVRARLEALLKANAAPRCGARSKRTGKPCRGAAMPNGRCKLHGGKSTGPRTPEGLERS